MQTGWISLHRSLLEHDFWKDERFSRAHAWIDLLLNANHTDKKVFIKGQYLEIKRGQQCRSQLTLSKIWGWDRKTVKRFLKYLENEQMITQQSTQLTTVITICKYDDFQTESKQEGQQEGQQNPQQKDNRIPNRRDTNNNDNNVNNDNKRTSKKNFSDDELKTKKVKSKLSTNLNFDTWPEVID